LVVMRMLNDGVERSNYIVDCLCGHVLRIVAGAGLAGKVIQSSNGAPKGAALSPGNRVS
jgi:hypothetical protein